MCVPSAHSLTHIFARQHARTQSAAGRSPAVRRPTNCRWLQWFHKKIQWRRARREEKREGGQKWKAINKSVEEKKRLLNPSLFIRLRFVFWLGRDVPRFGGIKGICWWMKFSRMGFHERKDKAGIRSISPFVPLQMKGTWTGRSQFLKAVLCASWILAWILVTIIEKPKHLQLKYWEINLSLIFDI